MLESFHTTLATVLAVYLVMGVGVVARRIGWMTPESDKTLLTLIVDLMMPSLCVATILSNPVFENRENLYLPPLLGYASIAGGIGLSWLFARFLPKSWTGLDTPKKVGTFAACAGMINYGYVPIPLLADLFPGDGGLLAVLFVLNLGTELALWTICVLAILGRFDRHSLFRLINIPSVVIITCLALNATGGDRLVPAMVIKIAGMIGQAAIPLSLIFIGGSIYDAFSFKELAEKWGETVRIAFFSTVIRLVILPAAILAAARWLPIPMEIKKVLVIYAAMASAIFPILLTKLHGGDVSIAMKTVLSNTTVAIMTTPIWIVVGMKWIESGGGR